jgi:SAM-dependent methyltransferase
MHPTAMSNGKSFFECYGTYFPSNEDVLVVEIGSQDVNGSLKEVCPSHFKYTGVDFVAAKNVDVVLTDPYSLPFENDSVDIVITSSCLEHSEMFWLVFTEVLRILKPHGLFYLNVPSRGGYHRYPHDCWRFYPDSGMALINWGKRNGFNPSLLESYTQTDGGWGDFVAVFIKEASLIDRYPDRVINNKHDYINGRQERYGDKIFHLLSSNNAELRSPMRFVPKPLRPLVKKIQKFF